MLAVPGAADFLVVTCNTGLHVNWNVTIGTLSFDWLGRCVWYSEGFRRMGSGHHGTHQRLKSINVTVIENM